MNRFLENKTDGFGSNMRPSSNSIGFDIQENFTRDECLGALCDFYKGPGAEFKDTADDFFKQHPDLE
ncbi:hypothetical protein [Pseudoteredinibacter isoporae]|nr:hypothetical protein [Pseudoteredinibacter isoporae]